MNTKKTKLASLPDKYPIHPAEEMELDEFSKWMALCNALKFINHTSQVSGIQVDEKDIAHGELINYINSVSGDIQTCLREKGGVPFKYSLISSQEEAVIADDLTYDFLDQ